MKAFHIILVTCFFITACQLQQVRKHDDVEAQFLTIGDNPVNVQRNTSKHNPLQEIHSPVKSPENYKSENDPVILKPEHFGLTEIRARNKNVLVPLTYDSPRELNSRQIPGIGGIEQKVDTRTILKINFENDLITYANTDRYFTNGIRFDLQAAWLSGSPLQKLMIPYRQKSYPTYNLSLVQNMYTPTDTKMAPALGSDRPYASVLYFGFRKSVSDPLRGIKIASELNVGYIGPYSLGSTLQTFVHKTFPTNTEPLGWETQIKTDFILNYNIQVQKALINKENFTLLAGLDAEAGTLYTNAGTGLQMQAGKAEPIFGLNENQQWPEIEYYFFTKTKISFVAYNALLQGGMFNHDNVLTLSQNEIQRVVGTAEAGIHFRYKGIGMELAQHYISPEYKGGLWHKWGRMSLIFNL